MNDYEYVLKLGPAHPWIGSPQMASGTMIAESLPYPNDAKPYVDMIVRALQVNRLIKLVVL